MSRKARFKINTTYDQTVQDQMSFFLQNINYENADFISLILLEENLQQMFLCSQTLTKEGLFIVNNQGNTVSHPALKAKTDAQTKIYNILKTLGGNMLDRKRLEKLDKINDSDSEGESDLEKFLKG